LAAQRPEALKQGSKNSMESTPQKPALLAAKTAGKAETIVYWTVTTLFCLQMSFTAYAGAVPRFIGGEFDCHIGHRLNARQSAPIKGKS
jgi:hypothetical protein